MPKKLSFWEMFKFTSLGYFPMGLIFALLSLFGVVPFNVNDNPITGIGGFLLMLAYIPFFGLTLSVLFWLFYSLGYWMNGLILKKKVQSPGVNNKQNKEN